MNEFFTWLFANSTSAIILASAIGLLVVTIVVVYIVVFLQGREISFYPPKLGPKLDNVSFPKNKKIGSNYENSFYRNFKATQAVY